MFLTELGFASCQIRVRLSLEHVVSYRRDISVVRAHGFNFHDSSNLLKFSSCRTLGRRNSHSADVCLFFLNDQSAEVERDISRSILKTSFETGWELFFRERSVDHQAIEVRGPPSHYRTLRYSFGL